MLKEPGRSSTGKSYMWLYRAGGCAGQAVVLLYEYQPTRKAEHAESFLQGFSEWLHADGYQGYSVYNMVISQIQSVCSSFITGMEAIFGDMLAKDEKESLHRTFNYYETLISVISTILFSVTVVMIVPFVKVYTDGIHDANYIEPAFAVVLALASYVYCIRTPYHGMVIAAGHFKETQVAAYAEAGINITVSLLLVRPLGLLGVAIGTLAATTVRLLYYAFYLRNRICYRRIGLFIKREAVNIGVFLLISILGNLLISNFDIKSYYTWIGVAVLVTVISIGVTLLGNYVFYKSEFKVIFRKIIKC